MNKLDIKQLNALLKLVDNKICSTIAIDMFGFNNYDEQQFWIKLKSDLEKLIKEQVDTKNENIKS